MNDLEYNIYKQNLSNLQTDRMLPRGMLQFIEIAAVLMVEVKIVGGLQRDSGSGDIVGAVAVQDICNALPSASGNSLECQKGDSSLKIFAAAQDLVVGNT